MRSKLQQEAQPWLILFGTGWGIEAETMSRFDAILEPIYGQANTIICRCVRRWLSFWTACWAKPGMKLKVRVRINFFLELTREDDIILMFIRRSSIPKAGYERLNEGGKPMNLIEAFEKEQLRTDIPDFKTRRHCPCPRKSCRGYS